MHFSDLILNHAFYPKNERCCVNPKDEEGRPLKSIVDNTLSKECFENEFGWIENDFSLLEKAKTDSERLMIINRLTELAKLPSNSGRTDDEILCDIVPRGMRDPVDFERYASKVLDNEARSYLDSVRKQIDDKKITFDQKDDGIIDNA